MQTNSSRVGIREGSNTFKSADLASLILELDRRLCGAESYQTITRAAAPASYISKIETYSDAAKTKKVYEQQFSRDGENNITEITSIFFHEDGSEDSRVTATLTRTSRSVTSSAGDFSSGEDSEP